MIWQTPAAQIALFWRCAAQGRGGLRTMTLGEEELAEEVTLLND